MSPATCESHGSAGKASKFTGFGKRRRKPLQPLRMLPVGPRCSAYSSADMRRKSSPRSDCPVLSINLAALSLAVAGSLLVRYFVIMDSVLRLLHQVLARPRIVADEELGVGIRCRNL